MKKVPKILNIMRISAFLLLLCIFTSFAEETYSQNAKVNITESHMTIGEFIDQIEKQTDYLFIYSKSELDTNEKVSVKTGRKTVIRCLDEVFRSTDVNYVFENDYIVLTTRQAPSLPVSMQQPQKTITGTVTDEQGEPIIGANVIEKGTTNGVITDMDGRFTLSVAEAAVLQVSYIGYEGQEIPIRNQTSFQITLREDSRMLDEVVVVGYGTVRKKDLTGAVASVSGEKLANRKTTQLSTALQGAIGGVMVTRDNNSPGATATVRVRGITTIGDTSPLVIVDGVPGDINQVNPNDIENISVLKDAASASIYGSRAAAGVILITTKRASENDLSLNYNFEYGWEMPTAKPEFVNAQRYIEMTNEMRYNDNNAGGLYQTYSQDQINNWMKYNATDPDRYPNTNWTDWILDDSAPRQSHTINIAGGSKKVKTKASFIYDKVDGLYSDRYYERFLVRANNDFNINKVIKASLDVNFRRVKYHEPTYNPIGEIKQNPTIPAVFSDGRYGIADVGLINPYAMMEEGGKKNAWYNRLGGKAALDITPVSGLTVSGAIAATYNFDKVKTFRTAIPFSRLDNPDIIAGYYNGFQTTKLAEDRNDDYNYTIQFIANYVKDFGKHGINIMGGYENYYTFSENLGASRDQYELTNYPYLNIGPSTYRDNWGSASEYAYRSWFGRVMYNYADKYLFQANIRHDGSSRFKSDYRWNTFPSFSLGWVMSEESFMKNADIPWLSFLKLRGSWGTLGNERIGIYPSVGLINFSNALIYQNGQVVPNLTAAQMTYVMENISWEKTETWDIGIDAYFFDNRLQFTGDYYKKTTKDMLLALEIPDYVGYDNPQKNTGKMFTKGYELELGWNDRIGELRYSVTVNFSDFLSKMGDLGGTEFLGDQVKKEGSEFNEWYGYLSDGLYQSQEDVDNSPKLNNNVRIGDIKYKDISGPDGLPDGKISSEYDRVLLGGSLPRFMYGANVSVSYRDFDLSFALQGIGSQNVRMTNQMMEYSWGNNFPAILDGDYWSSFKTDAENTKARYPRLTDSNRGSNNAMSDFWIFNGRYLRLKNITFGYTLPVSLTRKAYIDNLRLYVSGNDLFAISKYPKGYDPEQGNFAYPITRSVLFGVSINF